MRRAAVVLAAVMALGASIPGVRTAAAGPPLRYAGGAWETLDPAYIANAGDVQLHLQLYAGLTRLDETGEPYPSLASGWESTDGGRTYTFTIREGLRFSDGAPLTAEDLRRSWLRLLDPATGATAPDVLSVVVGAAERQAGAGSEEDVGIETPDDHTLVVRLNHPAAYFPAITATPATFAVPAGAGASDAWQSPDDFVGSGPYVVAETDGPNLILRANPEYVAGPPPIDEVQWLADLETDAPSAFAEGLVDLIPVGSWDTSWIAYDPELGPRLHASDALSVDYLGFDTTSPPFDDPRVRRAFALALDRDRLVPLYAGAAAEPAGSLVPPAIWPEGFAPGAASDIDEARRLLGEAVGGPENVGPVVINGTGIGVEPIVAAWEEELGVQVVVEQMEFSDYFAALSDDVPDVFTISWIADYPSPHALYSLLLRPGAVSNYGEWEDPRFVELLEAAAVAEDEEARADAYARVDAYVAEQSPVIPWAYGETWWLVADGLRGLGNLTVGLLDLGRVSWDG